LSGSGLNVNGNNTISGAVNCGSLTTTGAMNSGTISCSGYAGKGVLSPSYKCHIKMSLKDLDKSFHLDASFISQQTAEIMPEAFSIQKGTLYEIYSSLKCNRNIIHININDDEGTYNVGDVLHCSTDKGEVNYIYIHTYIHTYIYIYLCVCVCVCVCVYIYIVHMYIYINEIGINLRDPVFLQSL
jgi:hypothetical protein